MIDFLSDFTYSNTNTLPLNAYLIVSALLFGFGLLGLMLHRRSVIHLLMCIELLLLSVNTNFIAFSSYLISSEGQVFVFFILGIAAVEAAIGLSILVVLFRTKRGTDIDRLDLLKG
jgi:NADH-quinone oxidoreductase subunit K